MKYTDEQLSFIKDRGHNILVSAAAGSGKTAVITERVMSLMINDGYSVNELLIVTYTKAAAAEMRDRIRDAISERLMSDELTDEIREHLSRQMTLIYTADINTIDSFCLNLAREHFNVCNIDPSFRVADEGELKLISADVMEELIGNRYESGDERFFDLIDRISGGRDDSELIDAVNSVYRFAVARPDPAGYISSMMKEYGAKTEAELEAAGFMKELMGIAEEKLGLALSISQKALELCDAPGGPFVYRENIEDDIRLIRQLEKTGTYNGLRDALKDIKFTTLSRRSDDSIDPEMREKVKGLRNRAKGLVQSELAKDLFAKSTDDILYELEMCHPTIAMLAELALEYMDKYGEAKRERGVVDFSDLEHMALDILKDAETRAQISSRYRELIIDEYQDCNRVQEAIFTAISNGHDYVTVGDVKQSIYSFRDACPALFMEKYESYLTGEDASSRLITLSKNFRSSIDVTGTVNCVFEPIMSKRCGGVLYDDDQSLHYGEIYEHDQPGWSSEYLAVEYDPDGEEDKLTSEARAIASRIRQLVSDGLMLESRKDNSLRRCGYGDIVILLRSVSGASDTFSDVFAAEGIPLVFDSKSGYLLSYEIKEIMNLLKVIDNPRQDIPLAGVMMGYFGGFSASDMVYVRTAAEGGDLYDSLRSAASGENKTALAEKCRGFTDMLDRYRKMSVYTPIHELVDRIIFDFNYDHYVRALPDGIRREGNLRLLKKRAADYEQTSFHGLFKFLRYIDNMKKYEIDFGEAGGSGYTDAVRIMTIHHSKGLEFPVVFVSCLGKKMNMKDSSARILFDDDLGAGIDLVIRERNLKIRTLIKKIIAKKMAASARSEEMRVLYVAMTRAENKLILTAGKNESSVPKTDPSEAGALRDFVDMAREMTYQEIPFEKQAEQGEISSAEAGPAVGRVLELKEGVGGKETEGILRDLNYVYPYESSLAVPQKVSVSFIKHEAMEEKGVSIASDPRGDRVIPTAGALRGTAVHTAYENLPLDMEPAEEKVKDYLDGLVMQKKLRSDEREYIKTDDIINFLKTDICRRMREAAAKKELYREQPFIISVPASEVDGSYPEEDRIMVQGIIDAFFSEEDRVVVIDYKTDSVKDEKTLKDRYQKQLDYYADALCQLLGVKESEKMIYSVSLNKEIRL